MKVEQQSDAEHKRLEAMGKLIESSPVVIFLWRIEPGHWPVEVVSTNVQELLGYSTEDFISGRVSWPGITHPEDAPRLEQEVKDLSAAGRDEWSQQYRLLTKDGKPIWIKDWNRVLHDADGKATHIQALIMDITLAKQLSEELREKNDKLDQKVTQLRKLALEVTQAEERERKRLALLLHDDVQQFLAAATMKISLIDRNASSEEHGRMVRSALDLIGKAINSSRSLATELYPPVMIDGSFLPGVRWLAERMKERHGLKVELSGEEVEGMSSDLSMLLFRGVRELLFDVVKHAGVKTASVAVNQPDAKTIQVVVNDHGVGCSGNHAKVLATCGGLGLFSLRERLANIGGSLDVASVPGQGTTVSITVPIG